MRPRLLDLFCGAGGAAMGYHRAGFEVVGVDINPQPHYPFEFHQGDAMTWPLEGFDAIHASPPCQRYTPMAAGRWGNAAAHPDLVAPVRDLLAATGLPYIIENVEGAPLVEPVMLCGTMFGLGVRDFELRRHRLFEVRPAIFGLLPPCIHGNRRRTIGVYGGAGGKSTRDSRLGQFANTADRLLAMGTPWMNGSEVVEAIPPAYTEWIGTQLLASGLAQADGAVAFDLPLSDRPGLTHEATAQLPLRDLSTQRGSRHPETGSGFGEGEHLAGVGESHALGVANDLLGAAVDDPNVGRLVHALEAELADAGATGGAADGEAEALVTGLGVGHERGGDVGGGHRVLLRGWCASKVRDTAYVVKGVLS